jgi:hypothetical protein
MNKKTEWDIVVPMKLPISLKNVEPGKLHPSLLRKIPQGGQLHYLAADAWNAMVDAAKADGVELKPTSSGDTYRSYDSQKAGFLKRYQLQPIPGQSTKTFEGKTWYLKKGMAMLATPGKSNHNLGLAVDIHTVGEKKRLNWLIANVLKFGWSWEVVPSEPWHIRYTDGDQVPQAVKEWLALNPKEPSIFGTPAEQKATATAAAEAVVKAQEPKKIDVSIANGKPRLVKDNKGKAVKEAQTLLTKHGFRCRPDGDFGPKTQQAVKQFQQSKSIPVTGEVDELTWAALLS